MCRSQSMPLVAHRPPSTSTYSQLPTKMPTMPQSTVSQNGIRSRLPGATILPRMPMTAPPISRNRIPPRLQWCPHLTRSGAIVEMVTDALPSRLLGASGHGRGDHHEDRGQDDRDEEGDPVDAAGVTEEAVPDDDAGDAAEHGQPQRNVVLVARRHELAQQTDDHA